MTRGARGSSGGRGARTRRAGAVLAVGALAAGGALVALPPAQATPVARQVRLAGTDWTSAGVGGVGSNGTGDITISGVSGTVTHAYLSWNGIGPLVDGSYTGTYANPDISVNGTAVSGTSLGESGSNCWGDSAASRTYFADVTSIVKSTGGNGVYSLAGLGDHGDANGAVLVVTYQDADATNNRDLYLFYGNDTDAGGYPGEDTVWDDALAGISYGGGTAHLTAGVADGQQFGEGDDGTLMVDGPAGQVAFPDDEATGGLWDGVPDDRVADAGHSRAINGSLQDLKTFDVTGAFGDPGVQDLRLTSGLVNDCHSLDLVALDVAATGNQPPAPLTASVSPASTSEGAGAGKTAVLVFKVTLSARSTTPTTVSLHTEDGTATAPSDYKSTARTVTVPAGKRAATFKVRVVKDSAPEPSEFMYAVIDSASVPVATGAATGQILDDDSPSALARRATKKSAPVTGHLGRVDR